MRFRAFISIGWLAAMLVLFVSGVADGQETPKSTGKIAWIGADYNVYTLDFADGETRQITDDASNSRRYQWPTWSRSGVLAHFCCDPQFSRGLFKAEVYISTDGLTASEEIYSRINEGAIYAYWSPELCGAGAPCGNLAVLINNLEFGTLSVELFQLDERGISSRSLGTGQPFYYSWSPDGQQMVWHRNNRNLDIYDLKEAQITRSFQQISANFLAPAWSPVDDRILYGFPTTSRGVDLVIQAQDSSRQILVSDVQGAVSFSWSPDGNYVAYRTIFDSVLGPVVVVDAVTGEIVTQTSLGDVIAFFWSPDSKSIAYVTPASPSGSFTINNANSEKRLQNSDGLSWSVLDVSSRFDRVYSNFVPTSEMIYLLLYFDQFSQSHRVWSPDSKHLLYSEITGADEPQPVISLLDVTQADTVPLSIASGVFATWSFD